MSDHTQIDLTFMVTLTVTNVRRHIVIIVVYGSNIGMRPQAINYTDSSKFYSSNFLTLSPYMVIL